MKQLQQVLPVNDEWKQSAGLMLTEALRCFADISKRVLFDIHTKIYSVIIGAYIT